MTSRERRALYRLVAIAAAWAAGEALVSALGLRGLGVIVPAAFAIAAYVLTRDVRWPELRGRGEIKYWRGRRIDDDDWRH